MSVIPGNLRAQVAGRACEDQETQKLLGEDGEAEDRLGEAVSISSGFAIVGSRHDNENGTEGAAYVFRYDGSGWVPDAKLIPQDGVAEFFGSTVAVSGGTAVIGAPRDDGYRGSAFVFRFDGSSWTQEAKLVDRRRQLDDQFGKTVSIFEQRIILGVIGDVHLGVRSGSAFVFRHDESGWVEEIKLVPDDGENADLFGYAVAIRGDIAVIGAPYDDDNGRDSGSAYVFRFSGSEWVQEAKLLAADGTNFDHFGESIAVFGQTVVIGAQDDGDNGEHSGSVYVFRLGGSEWVQEAKLLAADGMAYDQFGHSVAVFARTLIVSAGGNDPHGAAYVFQFRDDRWTLIVKLSPPDGGERRFGHAVSLEGHTALIGAPFDDENGFLAGAAYVVPLCGACCQEDDACIDAVLLDDCGGRFTTQTSCDDLRPPCGTGACCTTDGTCTDQVPDGECGSRYADGVLCADLHPSCVVLGACCQTNGDCVDDVRIDMCAAGQRFEPLVRCDDLSPPCGTGACCAPDGACKEIINERECDGRWLHAMRCTDFSPACGKGACCGFDGSCVDEVPRDGCGTRYEGGVFCADIDPSCVAVGACCSGGHCDDWVREDECNAEFSQETLCADLDPPCVCVRDPQWECDGDVNGDGQVNPVDVGLVAAAFGSRDGQDFCNYDIDCDGQINPVDRALVQRLFGTCEPPREPCP